MIFLWILILFSFGIYSFNIFLDYGYMAFFPPVPKEVTLHVFLDLVIAGFIALYLMYDRRKKHQKSVVPVIITAIAFPFLGSQVLLIYLIFDWLTQKEKPSQRGLSSR